MLERQSNPCARQRFRPPNGVCCISAIVKYLARQAADVCHSPSLQDADPVSPLRSVVSSKRLGGSGTGGSSNNSISEAEQVSRVCSQHCTAGRQCTCFACLEAIWYVVSAETSSAAVCFETNYSCGKSGGGYNDLSHS